MIGDRYILDEERNPVLAASDAQWGAFFGDIEKRTVAKTQVSPDVEVSTVFLGIDHGTGLGYGEDDKPILFETMIFGGKHDQWQWRWSTWNEAVAGHMRAVERAARSAGKWQEPPYVPPKHPNLRKFEL